MGVSHTASKRVLQVQAAVNPESCCLWFAFSPQHLALQTQQPCRRVSGNYWHTIVRKTFPERATSCQSVQQPRLLTAAHQQLAVSFCGRCIGAGITTIIQYYHNTTGRTSSPQSRLSTSCSQSPAGKEQSWLCNIALDCIRDLVHCWHFMPSWESMYATKGLYAMVQMDHALSCSRTWHAMCEL